MGKKIVRIMRMAHDCKAIWMDEKGDTCIGSFPVQWNDAQVVSAIKGENVNTAPEKETKEKKDTSKFQPPPEQMKSNLDEKEQKKRILLAMKTRLANTKVDCATLKFDATKELYIKKFGAGEYTKLEQSFSGEPNNV